MSRNKKLLRFAENKTFDNFFEPIIDFKTNQTNLSALKGNWNKLFFKNSNPIVVELGCGRGEYSLALAQQNPNVNFIAVDIKGARMWKGAKEANSLLLSNIAFLRTHIEFVKLFFDKNEIDEIWLTFPDPQLGNTNKKIRKRLSSTTFLHYYQQFLKNQGVVNLKTDDDSLFNYTRKLIEFNNLELLIITDDLYSSEYYTDKLKIKTYYENKWIAANKSIKYLKFKLPDNIVLVEPKIEDEG